MEPEVEQLRFALVKANVFLFDAFMHKGKKHLRILGDLTATYILNYPGALLKEIQKNVTGRSHDRLRGSQMCIVTGPRIDLAVGLITRLKSLFTENGLVSLDTKENVIVLNGIHIEAYQSHRLDAMRGILNVSFILLNEADFFPPAGFHIEVYHFCYTSSCY